MKYPPEIYTRDELLALTRACPATDRGFRNRAMLHFLLNTGCRIGETLDLNVEDVDLDDGVVFIRHGKGDKHRRVGICSNTVYHIRCWLARRRRLGLLDRGPLFCNMNGTPFDRQGWYRMIHSLRKKAHVFKRVHAHGFRHTAATQCLREGWNLEEIATMLGHSSLQSTFVYLHKLPNPKVVDKMKARRPLPDDPPLLEGPNGSIPPAEP